MGNVELALPILSSAVPMVLVLNALVILYMIFHQTNAFAQLISHIMMEQIASLATLDHTGILPQDPVTAVQAI